MIVVIQCAAKKKSDAGCLRTDNDKEVLFVASPALAPSSDRYEYHKPDDSLDNYDTWRERLLDYNREPADNPLGLVPAWQLYENKAYERLVSYLGIDQLYILSAGWGLIRSDFLTPLYDITFSASAEKYKRRTARDKYADLNMIPKAETQPLVFLGGKDYVGLFCSLTAGVNANRYVYYNSINEPDVLGCEAIRFETTTRTNWHYECADALVAGQLNPTRAVG